MWILRLELRGDHKRCPVVADAGGCDGMFLGVAAPDYLNAIVFRRHIEATIYFPTYRLDVILAECIMARVFGIFPDRFHGGQLAVEEVLDFILNKVVSVVEFAVFLLIRGVRGTIERVKLVADVVGTEVPLDGFGTVHLVKHPFPNLALDVGEWETFIVWHDVVAGAVEGDDRYAVVAEYF